MRLDSLITFNKLYVSAGYLYYVTKLIMDSFNFESTGGEELKFLKVITEPLTKAILLVSQIGLHGVQSVHNVHLTHSGFLSEWYLITHKILFSS